VGSQQTPMHRLDALGRIAFNDLDDPRRAA
jgi:hypothetical protein